MAEHNPKTSLAKIIRYRKENPKEQETVGELIKGKAAVIKKLKKLRAEEPQPETYVYYWTWVNKKAAREFDAEKEGISNRKPGKT